MTAITDDPEFRALCAYSARIGGDPALIQGAGGNTSLKRDGTLWVKASGTWLSEAERRMIMVPVRLDPLRAALAAGDPRAETAADFVVAEDNPSGLRPSIEATLHAALPHRVVVHVHCVETIAWAARADAEAALAPRLAGLNWAFIPYIRPGPPLTRAIAARLAPGTDVLILGNHGLVAGGADTEAAAARIAEVASRLRRAQRPAPPPDHDRLAAAAAASDYVAAADPLIHAVATDARALAVARLGSFYPDHVIFLGPGIVEIAPGGRAAEIERALPRPPVMLVVPGAGVLLRRDASAGAAALARCLADVTTRLDPEEPLAPLGAAAEYELMHWEAEQYRKAQPAPRA